MRVDELHELLRDDLIAIRLQISHLDTKVDVHNARLPVLENDMAAVKDTLYDNATGLAKKMTMLEERVGEPGTTSDRRNNWIAAASLGLAVIALLISITLQLQGCTKMTKQQPPPHLNNLDDVDTPQEYNELKSEISTYISGIGKDIRIELTGDRTYTLEKDGTLYMSHAGHRRAHAQWRTEEWRYFREDVKHNRLLDIINAYK